MTAIIRILPFLVISICFFKPAFSEPSGWSASGEYLYWAIKPSHIDIPLVTQNPNPAAFGIIGEPGTSIIFGSGSKNDEFTFGGAHGLKIQVGYRVNEQLGFHIAGFGLERVADDFTVSSNNDTINIPFFSTETAQENVLVNRLPNIVSIQNNFQPFGIEFNTLLKQSVESYPFVFIAGLRYVNTNEKFLLHDAIFNNPSFPVGSIVNVIDRFTTVNHFYGIQLGATTHYEYDHSWDINASAKIGLGANYRELNIRGETNISNTIILQPIGLFSEFSNIGRHHQNTFAMLGELELKISYSLKPYFKPFIGYSFLFLSNQIRTGKNIDRYINLSQNTLIGGSGTLVGIPAPVPLFNPSSLWMQGLNAGFVVYFN